MKPFSRKEILEYVLSLKDVPCMDCLTEGKDGKWPRCAMHFDHVPERGRKVAGIAQWKGSFEELEVELQKCDIICANHHAMRTVSRTISDEVRQNMRKGALGRKHSPDSLRKIGEVARRYHERRRAAGIPAPKHSKEAKAKMSRLKIERDLRKKGP